MQTKSGQISVNTENIFPIIRKWLGSLTVSPGH